MPFVLLCIVWLSWGVSYPVTAIALAGFDVMTLRVAAQFLGAAVLLAQAASAGRRFVIARAAWPDLAISALLNMAVFPVCMNFGVYLMGPGRTSILVYTMPIWAGLFAWAMLGEKLTRNRIMALLLGAGAVAVLVSQDLTHVRDAPLGAALTLVAAMSFGLGTVWLKRRVWRADPSVIAFWQLAIGLLPLLLVWAAVSAPLDFSRVGPAQWAALGFLGVIASGGAYFAWFRIVGLLPASISGISSLVVPCIGLSSSAWLANEQIHAQDLAAMGLILTALACVLVEQWRERAALRDPTRAPIPRWRRARQRG